MCNCILYHRLEMATGVTKRIIVITLEQAYDPVLNIINLLMFRLMVRYGSANLSVTLCCLHECEQYLASFGNTK